MTDEEKDKALKDAFLVLFALSRMSAWEIPKSMGWQHQAAREWVRAHRKEVESL